MTDLESADGAIDFSRDLLWGAEEIAALIKRTRRQTFYLLETGAIPARKIGGHWVASRQALKDFLLGEQEANAALQARLEHAEHLVGGGRR